MEKKGMIHIYCGEGKGKTTAAIGLTIRAIGYGYKVMYMQFMKPVNTKELAVLKTIDGITVETADENEKFSFQMTESEKANKKKHNEERFMQVVNRISEEGNYNMFVIDECLDCIGAGLLEENLVLDFLKNKPNDLEVVMTGRSPSSTVINLAEYVSRIEKVKSPYDKGICSKTEICGEGVIA